MDSPRRVSGLFRAYTAARRIGISIILTLFLGSSIQSQEMPAGWRKPTDKEGPGKWRQKSGTRFLEVRGDFDGDGIEDVAALLVNPRRNRYALFVRLGSDGKWQMLGKAEAMSALEQQGIDLVKPGRYETACGKGYDESFCAHGEPDYLKLSLPAIDVFYHESADTMFYWDKQLKKFRSIQMSD